MVFLGCNPTHKPPTPPTIQLTEGHGTTLNTITRKECWEGARTLGVRLAPLGNFQDEHAYRLLQFRGLAQNMSLLMLFGISLSADLDVEGLYFVVVLCRCCLSLHEMLLMIFNVCSPGPSG